MSSTLPRSTNVRAARFSISRPIAVDRGRNRTAAVAPLRPKSKNRRGRGPDGSVTEKIRTADENGPGVVGYYLDYVADLVARFRMEVQVWDSGQGSYVSWSDPVVTTALNSRLVGSQGEEVPDFVRSIARDIAAVGEVGFAKLPGSPPTYWVLPVDPGSYHVVDAEKDGTPTVLAWPSRKGLTKPRRMPTGGQDPDWLYFQGDQVRRFLRPHPRYHGEPFSPLMRVMPDVRRFQGAGRALHRAVASRLVNSNILAIKAGDGDLGVDPSGNVSIGPRLGDQISSLLDDFESSLLDVDEKLFLSAAPHIFVSDQDKPMEVVDLGPVVEPTIAAAKDDALIDIARGLSLPQEVLVNGIGSAHRLLNERNLREGIEEAIRPLARLVASVITTGFLRPALEVLPSGALVRDGLEVQPGTVRLWPSQLSLSADSPDIDDLFRAVEMGILDPDILARALEAEDHRLDLGDSTSSADWWRSYIATRPVRARAASSEWDRIPK